MVSNTIDQNAWSVVFCLLLSVHITFQLTLAIFFSQPLCSKVFVMYLSERYVKIAVFLLQFIAAFVLMLLDTFLTGLNIRSWK